MVGNIKMFRKKTYTDYVDLSIGRVYIKPLYNGLVNKATINSTIVKDNLNSALFFYIIELGLTCLSRKKIAKLTVVDGDKLRNRIRDVLIRHGILTENKKENKSKISDDEEEKVFNEQYNKFSKRVTDMQGEEK